MTMPISLESLQALDAIDRRGSFAATSEELHRVPSAVSYTIQRMEQQLASSCSIGSASAHGSPPPGRSCWNRAARYSRPATRSHAPRARCTGAGGGVADRGRFDLPARTTLRAAGSVPARAPHTRVTLREEVLGGTWESLAHGRSDLVIGATSRPGFADVRTRPDRRRGMGLRMPPGPSAGQPTSRRHGVARVARLAPGPRPGLVPRRPRSPGAVRAPERRPRAHRSRGQEHDPVAARRLGLVERPVNTP